MARNRSTSARSIAEAIQLQKQKLTEQETSITYRNSDLLVFYKSAVEMIFFSETIQMTRKPTNEKIKAKRYSHASLR